LFCRPAPGVTSAAAASNIHRIIDLATTTTVPLGIETESRGGLAHKGHAPQSVSQAIPELNSGDISGGTGGVVAGLGG